jgi:hypothetical protein
MMAVGRMTGALNFMSPQVADRRRAWMASAKEIKAPANMMALE